MSIGIVNDSIDDEVLQEETLVVNEYNILDAPVIISRLRKEVNDCMHTHTCMHYAHACKCTCITYTFIFVLLFLIITVFWFRW